MQRDGRTTLERAFELARGGEHSSVDTIRRQLKAEQHDQVESHLSGSSITTQLKGLMNAARKRLAEQADDPAAQPAPAPARPE